jgi:chromosome segregation ATPase
MTGEEMERAIEFLLQSQADFEGRLSAFDTRLERMQEQLAETNRQLQSFADTQAQFIQTVTSFVETQDGINGELRAGQVRLGENLNLLATTVQRFIEGQNRT